MGRKKLPDKLRKEHYLWTALIKKHYDGLEKLADKADKILPDFMRDDVIIPFLKKEGVI